MKKRGYADFFDWPEKGQKECEVAATFVEELKRDSMEEIANTLQHPGGKNEPPDYRFTTKSGARWGVEITELVYQKAVEKVQRQDFNDEERRVFEKLKLSPNIITLWSDENILEKLRWCVKRKDHPKNVWGELYDSCVLLIHTDEPNLPAKRLCELLKPVTFETHLVDQIYILVSYDPSTQRCPLLRLNVTKAAGHSSSPGSFATL